MQCSNLAPGEHFVQCPYNVSHQIINRRLITHLDKCRKQYEKEEAAKGRKPDIVACRFNFSHRVNKLEIRIHESECPDQYTVIHSIAAAEAELKQSEPVMLGANRPNSNAGVGYDDGEDWDADCTTNTEPGQRGYDPSIKLKEGHFLYTKPGMTKSERQAAREENRRKYFEMTAKLQSGEIKPNPSMPWQMEEVD